MVAIIIDFRAHCQLKSARLDNREPARRGRTKRAARRHVATASLDQQIAHVSWLLRELEDITRGGERLPQVLVAEAHDSIERTRKMLQWRHRDQQRNAGEDAAQPSIDPALLDRMYSDLGLHP